MAARAKDGIFLPPAQFTEMQERIAGLGSQLCELEDELDRKTTHISEVEEALESANNEVNELEVKLQNCQTELASTKNTLQATETELSNTKNTLCLTEALLKQSQDNEAELRRQAEIATDLYRQRLSDIQTLQRAVARKDAMLQSNNQTSQKYAELASTKCSEIATALTSFKDEQTDRYSALKNHLTTVASTNDKAVGDMMNQFKSIEKDIACLVEGYLDKYIFEHEQHEVHRNDQISKMETEAKKLGTSISSLTPLVEKLSTKLTDLVLASLDSASKITSQVENECQVMQEQMETYILAQDKMLLNLEDQLAKSLNEESKKISSDATQLVNALQITKDSMAERIAEIQSSLKQQLDQCLESVVASLSHESSVLQERTNSTSKRLINLLDNSSKDIKQVQTAANDTQTRMSCQTNSTKDSMKNYLEIAKSESIQLRNAISEHAIAAGEYQANVVSDTKSTFTNLTYLLDDQANKRSEQLNTTTQWIDSQFTDLQHKQEKYVNLTNDSAKYIKNECSELSNNVKAIASLTEDHTTSMALYVKDENKASSDLIASISMDQPTGSTPRKPLSDANFPTFKVSTPLPEVQKSEATKAINPLADLASPRRKSESVKSVNPLADLASPRRKSEAVKAVNSLAELASPKRKLEDPNGSRLQPPKKYSKTNES
ncbi:hypothetical protein THRCLA_03400 [Thraustotheca clavata]|uniref:Kinesin n=1 Tax=Thraustotheca clavata TaxID=74557 RepID=A0A1W0A2E8_9STRA|nr:hypothetical protein THRCLA_03400 [Thraustotheca clavata]